MCGGKRVLFTKTCRLWCAFPNYIKIIRRVTKRRSLDPFTKERVYGNRSPSDVKRSAERLHRNDAKARHLQLVNYNQLGIKKGPLQSGGLCSAGAPSELDPLEL